MLKNVQNQFVVKTYREFLVGLFLLAYLVKKIRLVIEVLTKVSENP